MKRLFETIRTGFRAARIYWNNYGTDVASVENFNYLPYIRVIFNEEKETE